MARNRPVDPIVDLIRRLGLDIGVVENLYGNVFERLRSLLSLKRTGWYYVQLPANAPLTPREAYLKGANNVNPEIVPSDDGIAELDRIKDYEDGKGLFLYTGVDTRQPTQARVTVNVPNTEIALYVNDTLLVEGTDSVTKVLQVSKKDTLIVSLYRRPATREKVLILEGTIEVPPDLTIGLLPGPPDAPLWDEEQAARFGFIDNTKERQGLLLKWKDNPAAGGWFLQKTEFDALGEIVAIEDNTEEQNSITFQILGLHEQLKGLVVVSGTFVGIISSGVVISSGESLLEQITEIYVDVPNTFVPSGSFGALPSGVLFSDAWIGYDFFESNPPSIIKDIDRQSPKGVTLSVPDEEIRFGFPYIYRLAAWHPFHKEVRSEFSDDNFITLPFEVFVEVLSHRWVPSGLFVSGTGGIFAGLFNRMVPIYFLELALHIGSGTKSLNFVSEWEREHGATFAPTGENFVEHLSFDYNINVSSDLDHRILASGVESPGESIIEARTAKFQDTESIRAPGTPRFKAHKLSEAPAIEDKYIFHYNVRTDPGSTITVSYIYRRPGLSPWVHHSSITFGEDENIPVIAEKVIEDMGAGSVFGLEIIDSTGTGGEILPGGAFGSTFDAVFGGGINSNRTFGVTWEELISQGAADTESRAFFPPPPEFLSPWDKISYVKITPYSEPAGSLGGGIPGITKTIFVDTTESTGSGVALKQQDEIVRKGRAIEVRPFFDGQEGPTGGPQIKVREAYDAGIVSGSWTPDFNNGPGQRVMLQGDTTIEYPTGIISTETFHLYIETNGFTFTLANTSPGYIIPFGEPPPIEGLCHCNFIVNWRTSSSGDVIPGDLSGVILPDMNKQGQVNLEV